MPEQQRFLTIAEAAEFLHVSQTSLRRWTNSGKLRSLRVGGRNERRFLVDDLLAFVPSALRQLDVLKHPAAEIQMATVSESQERHICLFFLSVEEQWQVLRPYILESLHANIPVIYIQGSIPHDHFLDLLANEGLPLEDLIARGLLRLFPPEQTYLLGGNLGKQGMFSFIEALTLGALEVGYKRILIVGEMTWTQGAGMDGGQLKTFAAKLNPLIEKYPAATILCLYDLRRFDGPGVLNALITHPSIHLPSGRVPGFYGLEK